MQWDDSTPHCVLMQDAVLVRTAVDGKRVWTFSDGDPCRKQAPSRRRADLKVEAGGRDAAVVEQAGGRVQRQPDALAGAYVGPRHNGDSVDPDLHGDTSCRYRLCSVMHPNRRTAAQVKESLLSFVLLADIS